MMSERDYVCPSLALLLGWDLQRQVLDGDRGQCFDPRIQDDCSADVVQPAEVCSGGSCFSAGVRASDSPMSGGESGGWASVSRSGGSGESSVSGVQVFRSGVAVHTPGPNPCDIPCGRSTRSAVRPVRGILSASTSASRTAAGLVGRVVRFVVENTVPEELLQASRALRERACQAGGLKVCFPAEGSPGSRPAESFPDGSDGLHARPRHASGQVTCEALCGLRTGHFSAGGHASAGGEGSSSASHVTPGPDSPRVSFLGVGDGLHAPLDGGSTPSSRDSLALAAVSILPQGLFAFVSFDICRGPVVYHLPHGHGPEEAVRHALQHAPFPDPAWTYTQAHVPGYPSFQILLMRRQAPITVLLDTRPLAGEVSVVEAVAAPFSGQQFAVQSPLARRSPIVIQLLRASSLVLFYNHRPWVLAYVRSLTSGDLVCFAGRPGSFLQPGRGGIRWSPSGTSSDVRCPPLLVARVGAAGAGCGLGAAPRPHLLLALARALRDLLQESPDLSRHFIVAAPLQDPPCSTYQEVRFVAVQQIEGETPIAWLDRRLIGGGIHHLQVPCFLRAGDIPTLDNDLIVLKRCGGSVVWVYYPASASRTLRRRADTRCRSLPP